MRALQKGLAWLVVLLAPVFLLEASPHAQEEKETPSQKTKEAIQRFKKAPGAVGKGVEALKEAGREKLQEILGTKTPPAPRAGGDSLTVPKRPDPSATPRYSSEGRRDPFRPLALKTKVSPRTRESLSPLERYELGQLKLVGIVWDINEPKAMVEDAAGLGFIVKVGTPIGPNEGKIRVIKPTEVVVEEIYTDFYGVRKKREVSMRLPTE